MYPQHSIKARPMPPSNKDSSATGQQFVPKQFPPPALQGIPEQYVVDQLHRLADSYWYRPESCDVTLVVPIEQRPLRLSSRSRNPSITSQSIFSPATVGPVLGLDSRRGSEATAATRTRMSLRLHQDYLVAQSTLFRSMLSRSSHLDLNSGQGPTPPTPSISPTSNTTTSSTTSSIVVTESGRPAMTFHVPPNRMPRVLPSSPAHPILFLPLPDPASFPHIIHYLYFGSTTFLSESLAQGTIKWESVVRNVEYLGLRPEIKAFLGRWYRQNMAPRTHVGDPVVLEEGEEDLIQDSDDDEDEYPVTPERMHGDGFMARS